MCHFIIHLLSLALIVCGSLVSKLNAARNTRILEINFRKAQIERKLAESNFGNRIIVDKYRLHPSALLFNLPQQHLIDYVKLCSRVSMVGQQRLPKIDKDELWHVQDLEFHPKREFIRGNEQVSGYLLMHYVDNNRVKMIACFAGTSSKADILQIARISDMILHETPVHRGVSSLVYKNIVELNKAVQDEREAGRSVEMMITGHSLGGAISTLAIFDLRNHWKDDRNVTIRCLNLAGPSPFRSVAYQQQVLDTIGYSNILNIYRKADLVYQGAEFIGMLGVGPTLFFQDKLPEEQLPRLKKALETFANNHYVTRYLEHLEDRSEDDLWQALTLLKEEATLDSELHTLMYLNEVHHQSKADE